MNKIVTILFICLCFFLMSNSTVGDWSYIQTKGFPKMPLPIEYEITNAGIKLGELIFNDKRLSIDNSISCSSCHIKKFAFADNNALSFGVDSGLQNRNTLALFNLAWYGSYFWDGRVEKLEDQISFPIHNKNEMNSDWNNYIQKTTDDKILIFAFQKAYGRIEIDSIKLKFALAQFLRSLISNQSKFDSVIAGLSTFTEDEYLGFELVNDGSRVVACSNCHQTEPYVLGTNLSFANNGLVNNSNLDGGLDNGVFDITKNSKDIGKFKVPSLRNLKFTAPYMHDGRFNTLFEVLDYYSHSVPNNNNLDPKMQSTLGKEVFSMDEKRRIVAFLNTMNDYEFVKE